MNEKAKQGLPAYSEDALSPMELGQEGEHFAAAYLAARGYEIIERHWSCCEGEVALVCKDEEGTVVLVEVKSRHDRELRDLPEIAVDEGKQRKLARIALWYLVDHLDTSSLRFDVVAVNFKDRRNARIRHLLGAFVWEK